MSNNQLRKTLQTTKQVFNDDFRPQTAYDNSQKKKKYHTIQQIANYRNVDKEREQWKRQQNMVPMRVISKQINPNIQNEYNLGKPKYQDNQYRYKTDYSYEQPPPSSSSSRQNLKNKSYTYEYQQNTNDFQNSGRKSSQDRRKKTYSSHLQTESPSRPSTQRKQIRSVHDNSNRKSYLGNPLMMEYDQNQDKMCYSIDQDLLQNANKNHKKLQQYLLENYQTDDKIDFKKFLEQNPDYINHYIGNCACALCVCGTCRCQYSQLKLNFKCGKMTEYDKQFISRNGIYSTPQLNANHYSTLTEAQRLQNNKLGLKTQYQKEFIEKQMPQKIKKKPYEKVEIPLNDRTSYNNFYPNWGEYDPNWKFRRPDVNNATGLPFNNKTNYQSTLCESNLKPQSPNYVDHDIKKFQKNQAMPNSYFENKQSHYQQKYQGYDQDGDKDPKVKYVSQLEKVNSVPTFDGQYRSHYKGNFKGNQDFICPAKLNNQSKPFKLRESQTNFFNNPSTVSQF